MTNIIKLRHEHDRSTRLNVLGEPIEECSCDPMTGWFRDGTCATDDNDLGRHVVCSVMTREFLEFARSSGNDLITPRPDLGFPGLQPGNHWCVCAETWEAARQAGAACPVMMGSTHQSALEVLRLEDLRAHAADPDHLN